jgi:hypothetical protein
MNAQAARERELANLPLANKNRLDCAIWAIFSGVFSQKYGFHSSQSGKIQQERTAFAVKIVSKCPR